MQMASTTSRDCCKRINPIKMAHASAAAVVYIQGLFWLTFSLRTTVGDDCNMSVNVTSTCENYPKHLCGSECPTGLVFLALVYTSLLVGGGVLLLNIMSFKEGEDKYNFPLESRIALVLYTVSGIVTTALELVYFQLLFGLVTGALYLYAIIVTRECFWKNYAKVYGPGANAESLAEESV